MPLLEEISYSRAACIAAVRDYYDFLTKMYLNEKEIEEPPPEGWPSITIKELKELGKTDEVIELLRRLPYTRLPDEKPQAEVTSDCTFANWKVVSRSRDFEYLRVVSESYDIMDNVPAHVVGLAAGKEDNPVFLLDTQLGVVFWYGYEEKLLEPSDPEPVEDDPSEYAPENEEWRLDSAAWEVETFFSLLKDRFRRLRDIPISSRRVIDAHERYNDIPGRREMVEMLRKIYREHGWPDLDKYRKQECLRAVRDALEEWYPHEAPERDEDDEDGEGSEDDDPVSDGD